jgi:6-phosphogluconolactonase/glucosamine-6-phosphate isomerase/deaminase
MSIVLNTTINPDDAVNYIASSVLSKLKQGKKVLFFVTGGSSIPVGVKISDILKDYPNKNLIQNLTIMLTDERYGPVDHFNSNYFQLKEKGFDILDAEIIPILIDNDSNITTEKFNTALNEKFMTTDYKIGMFGVGVDGHTAGILPDSAAVFSQDLAFGYDTSTFSRITMTPKAIEKLDEAVVWAQGKDKWDVIKDLKEKDLSIIEQPAQILKKVSLLTIFSDFNPRQGGARNI